MTTDELRAKFEAWFRSKFTRWSPDKSGGVMAWLGYQQGYVSRDAEVEALRKRINDAPVYYVPTKKPDSEDGWLQVIGSVKALNDMRGKHVRLVIDAAMREESK